MIAIRMTTTNDSNGNGRRLWLVIDPEYNASTVEAIDERGIGNAVISDAYPSETGDRYDSPVKLAWAEIQITPREYKRLLKTYPELPAEERAALIAERTAA